MTDLRDKIARALFLFDYGHQGADAWEASRLDGNSDRPHAYAQADAVLAVLDLAKVKAEARVEVLREVSDTLAGAEPQHLGGADEGLEFFDYGTGAEYGIDVAAAYLRIVANRIAREAGIATEGNKTGEGND